jgi:hypothetical protein
MRPKAKQLRDEMSDADFRRSVGEFVRDVTQILSGNTGVDNLRAQEIEIGVTGADTNVDLRVDLKRLGGEPRHVLCTAVVNLDDPEQPGSLGGSVPWCHRAPTPSEAYVRVLSFPGLGSSTRYLVRFLILGG